MIKTVGKYIGIGILLGIGMCLVDYIYFQMVREERLEMMEEAKSMVKEMADLSWIRGSDSVFNNPKKYNPAMGLNFSLQEYELKEETITVAGVLSNVGVEQWRAVYVELEVFNKNGEIVAECNYASRDIEPGAWEALIVECPILKSHVGKPINSLNFRVKKAFHDKTHVPDSQPRD